MKKVLSTIILLVSMSFVSHYAQSTTPTPQIATTKKTLSNFDATDLITCFNLIQATIANANEIYTDAEDESSHQVISLAKSFIDVYLHTILVTICHELGHAVAAKILTNSPIDIHIGAYEQLPNAFIHTDAFSLESLNPAIGYTLYNQAPTQGKQAIILLSGGTSGLMAHIFFKALKIYFRTYKNKTSLHTLKKITASFHDSVTKISALDFIAGVQLANILIPMGSESDAAKLWRIAGVPTHVVDPIAKIGPFAAGILIGVGLHVARKHQHNGQASFRS